MKIIVRDMTTRTLETEEYCPGIIPEFPPEWRNAYKVKGYQWDWEVPAKGCIWVYGMTQKEYNKHLS